MGVAVAEGIGRIPVLERRPEDNLCATPKRRPLSPDFASDSAILTCGPFCKYAASASRSPPAPALLLAASETWTEAAVAGPPTPDTFSPDDRKALTDSPFIVARQTGIPAARARVTIVPPSAPIPAIKVRIRSANFLPRHHKDRRQHGRDNFLRTGTDGDYVPRADAQRLARSFNFAFGDEIFTDCRREQVHLELDR